MHQGIGFVRDLRRDLRDRPLDLRYLESLVISAMLEKCGCRQQMPDIDHAQALIRAHFGVHVPKPPCKRCASIYDLGLLKIHYDYANERHVVNHNWPGEDANYGLPWFVQGIATLDFEAYLLLKKPGDEEEEYAYLCELPSQWHDKKMIKQAFAFRFSSDAPSSEAACTPYAARPRQRTSST